ncbi:MAG: YibE/F family protein [Anaerolineales bacterium]
MRKKVVFYLVLCLCGLLCFVLSANAAEGKAAQPEEEILPAVVGFVSEEGEVEYMGHMQQVQELDLVVNWGPRRGETLTVEHVVQSHAGERPYREGDRVYVSEIVDAEGNVSHYIVGYARWTQLFWLGLLFVGLVVLVGRGRGISSLLGLVVSFVIIFLFILPRLGAGANPLRVALIGAALTMPISYYLAHGLNRKTTVALAGSLLGLVVTGLLALVSVSVLHLSGYASEEAGFLQTAHSAQMDIRGLLLAGIIIGVLGVLDDITVSQAAIVEQLRQANPAFTWRQLYRRAMRVGQDHIASMVNTLVLVYAGSALPLLLLLGDRSLPVLYVLSHEMVAEEIVRMLVTSSGLVAAVPVTTALAALAARMGELVGEE